MIYANFSFRSRYERYTQLTRRFLRSFIQVVSMSFSFFGTFCGNFFLKDRLRRNKTTFRSATQTSHNASLRIQIPGSQISTEICIKLFTKPIRHLVEKLSSDIEGLAWYSFWKHYSPKSRYVFANSSSCQYDAVEVSFQEKLDGLFWSAVVSRASRFRLLFYSLITSLVILMLSIFSRLSIDSCT